MEAYKRGILDGLKSIASNHSYITTLVSILLLVALNLLSSIIYECLGYIDASYISPKSCYFLSLPLIICTVWLFSHRIARNDDVIIIEKDSPRKVKVLIFSLSFIGEDEETVKKITKKHNAYITNKTVRERFKKSWRMPIEAITYHLEKLKLVVVIPSLETEKHVEVFKELIKSSVPRKYSSLEILSMSELNNCLNSPVFVSAEAQHNLLKKIFETLIEKKKYKEKDIIIDITGGKATSSIAGMVTALTKGRRVQYVNTTKEAGILKYNIREYDIEEAPKE